MPIGSGLTGSVLTATLMLAVTLCLPAYTRAQARSHEVRSGQSLARIARRYHVSVANLAAANGLSRRQGLRPGQVLRVPDAGTHYVASGETLSSIARDHETTVQELRRLNRIRGGSLRAGQRLVLPGHEAAEQADEAAERWGRPRSPGVVRLYRREIDRHLRARLVDRRGRARRVGVRRVQELMRPRRRGRGRRLGRMGPAPPRRLVEILTRISDHFGGREITIVSGYRSAGGYTRESSRHTEGHALDIRIRGVPNTALRDYVRSTFDNVGVGFYPRSSFVHVDVRDRSTYWVDWSRPGQAPQYQRRGDAPPPDATDGEVERTQLEQEPSEDE
ncbi:MAG: LysM peptidoglycan-binding domain-containing protein [Sandaracinaceae bacterium]